ncbi:hypothetical protein [Marinobacter alkaliphilus]|uniref:Uncharacterized protein n=1 Tax=Marinobacter alkaliphilus TaxID=254719 RepID=A0ABZ3E2U2_9GAMM
MNALSEYWAMVNTAVIMLALGMRAPTPVNIPVAGLLRAVVLYNIALPSVALALFYAYGVFATNTLAALSLCVAAAGGTSSGAFVGAVQGMTGLAVRLFILLLIASLIMIGAFTHLGWVPLGNGSLASLGFILFALTLLPLLTGKVFLALLPNVTATWQPKIEKLGSLLVILLVISLAARYGAGILSGPGEPLLAGVILTLILVLPPLLEPDWRFRRTVTLITVVRNLSLALSLLALTSSSTAGLNTLLTFGLFMYLAAGLLVWRWKTSLLPDRGL